MCSLLPAACGHWEEVAVCRPGRQTPGHRVCSVCHSCLSRPTRTGGQMRGQRVRCSAHCRAPHGHRGKGLLAQISNYSLMHAAVASGAKEEPGVERVQRGGWTRDSAAGGWLLLEALTHFSFSDSPLPRQGGGHTPVHILSAPRSHLPVQHTSWSWPLAFCGQRGSWKAPHTWPPGERSIRQCPADGLTLPGAPTISF